MEEIKEKKKYCITCDSELMYKDNNQEENRNIDKGLYCPKCKKYKYLWLY